MPTETAPAQASAPAKATTPAPSPQITLDQFALETSAKDKRVALLHGFVFEEKRARRVKDTESAYQARYAAFANKPV